VYSFPLEFLTTESAKTVVILKTIPGPSFSMIIAFVSGMISTLIEVRSLHLSINQINLSS
jgi:hypothetical protein